MHKNFENFSKILSGEPPPSPLGRERGAGRSREEPGGSGRSGEEARGSGREREKERRSERGREIIKFYK